MFTNLGASEAQLLDQVLDGASTGLFLIDSTGLIIYCNPLVKKLIDASGQQFVGQPYTELLNQIAQLSSDPQQALKDIATALRHLEQPLGRGILPVPHQFCLSTRGEITRRLQIRFFPFAGAMDTGRSWMWTGVIQEVSQEWDTITEQAQYLSRVIKELRISFAEITGSITPLLDNHLNWEIDERHHFLQSFSARIEQQKRILENVHDLFKLELGDLSIGRRLQPVGPIIERAIRNLGGRNNECHFEIALPEDFPHVLINPSAGERIFRNILGTILEHAPKHSILQIDGTTAATEAFVSIKTPGIALNKDELQHLFDPFSSTTATQQDALGSSLDLYTAQQFIVAQGGRLWAECPDQAGVIFHCVFSVKEEPEQPASRHLPTSPSKAKPKTGKRAKTANGRVMVVEDDPNVAQMMKMMLTRVGYQTTIANSGQHALEIVYDEPPDIILMDLHMPGMDGFTLTSQLHEALPVPIIAVTADSRRETRMRALSLGVDDYLTKPVDPDELIARIRNILQRASGRIHGQHEQGIHIGSLHIDLDRRQASVDGQAIKLAPIEFKLLHVLARNPDRILTYDQLLKAVWGPQYGDEKQYLWVHVNRLRRKLADTTSHTEFIQTEPGIGYRLVSPNVA